MLKGDFVEAPPKTRKLRRGPPEPIPMAGNELVFLPLPDYFSRKIPYVVTRGLMKKWAAYFSAECLSTRVCGMVDDLRWRCHKGHEFSLSPNHIKDVGWYCPVCWPDAKRDRTAAEREK